MKRFNDPFVKYCKTHRQVSICPTFTLEAFREMDKDGEMECDWHIHAWGELEPTVLSKRRP